MKAKIPRPASEGEEPMALHIRAEKLPNPEREYPFAKPQRMFHRRERSGRV